MPPENRTKKVNYVIVSPVKNEADYIEMTLHSVISQSIRPRAWIIVNDGSTDKTGQVIESCAKEHPWIRVVDREAHGHTGRGAHVVEVFYDGYELVDEQFDFIVKLDGDISFDSSYFAKIFDSFEARPDLGIAGGRGYEPVMSRWIPIKNSDGHVCGATKVYRKTCFQEIGGLARSWGWDGIDELKAEMKGWQTWTVASSCFFHHRPEGGRKGAIRGRFEQGSASYVMGYAPLFMIFRGARRMASQPYMVGGGALILGYVYAFLRRSERYTDAELRRYLRRKQFASLKAVFLRPFHFLKTKLEG